MDSSKEFQFMLDKAISSEPLAFKGFDRTKNVQDQLQEMVKDKRTEWQILINECSAFVHKPECYVWANLMTKYIPKFTTMEQLWLGFVMKERYHKVWSKTEWIKES